MVTPWKIFGDDGDLVDPVRVWQQAGDDGVPSLVVAVRRRSPSGTTMLRLSTPMDTLSFADSKSWCRMASRSSRAAMSAASLTRFSRSAPLNPGVPFAMVSRSTSSARGVRRV